MAFWQYGGGVRGPIQSGTGVQWLLVTRGVSLITLENVQVGEEPRHGPGLSLDGRARSRRYAAGVERRGEERLAGFAGADGERGGPAWPVGEAMAEKEPRGRHRPSGVLGPWR